MSTLAKKNDKETFNFNSGKRCSVTLGPSGRIKVVFTFSDNGISKNKNVDLDMLPGKKSAEGITNVTQVIVTNNTTTPSIFTVVAI